MSNSDSDFPSDTAELLRFALDTFNIMNEHMKRRPPCEHCVDLIGQVKNRWEKQKGKKHR